MLTRRALQAIVESASYRTSDPVTKRALQTWLVLQHMYLRSAAL
jgi:hypothetical protein